MLALIAARDTADLGAPDSTAADLEAEWAASRLDLARDVRVAEDADGRIVGYAILRRTGALVIGHPGGAAHGVTTELLVFTERRERELGRAVHRRWAAASDHRGRELLQAAGYAPARSFWRMSRRLAGSSGVALAPNGVTLRGLDLEGDGQALHELDELAFAANPDFESQTLAEFRAEHLDAHDRDPGLSLVAVSAGAPVGFLLAARWATESVGYVDILAVAPRHRRRGLGRALLTAAFSGFAAAGLRTAELGVASDNPRALELYENAGMVPRFRIDSFERSAR